MLKKILIGIGIVLAGLAVVVATRPAAFKVTRSAVVAAAPAAVFAQVNDFKKWEAWSPWAKLDPASTATYEGPSSGVGAKFGWAGNKDVGVGQMTITESLLNERIVIQLDFVKPMKATNQTEFTFTPQTGGTLVTWTMSGRNNFVGKAMSLVFDCDKMIGGFFEKGLAQLNDAARRV